MTKKKNKHNLDRRKSVGEAEYILIVENEIYSCWKNLYISIKQYIASDYSQQFYFPDNRELDKSRKGTELK